MSDRLLALRIFTRVARTGSFSRAGRELGLSQPSASRVVAGLELEVGASLLTRTTRAMVLTEAGADYLARIEPILAALEEADQAVRSDGELRGVLRVALSSSFAVREVIPRLPTFMAQHPALRIELLMSDQRQHLVNEGIDVALRMGPLTDSLAVARKLGVSPRLLVASPLYLARAGSPETPEELAAHDIIIGPAGVALDGWAFERAGHRVFARVVARLSVSVNEGAVAAATVGVGIVSTAAWGCRAELDNGSLQRVLPEWKMGDVDVHAVFPAGRSAKSSARAFCDFLCIAMI